MTQGVAFDSNSTDFIDALNGNGTSSKLGRSMTFGPFQIPHPQASSRKAEAAYCQSDDDDHDF